MIQLNTAKQLNIILPNTNKALEKALKNASPEELQTLTKAKNLGSILDGILKGSIENSEAQNRTLLSLLKNNPSFKEMSNVTTSIKDLLAILQKDKNPLPLEKTLTNFLENVKNMSEKELKSKIENSGLFLENKIKNMSASSKEQMREMFANDLKSILLKAQDEIQSTSIPNKQDILKQIDKLLLQIDYHQLLSHLSNGSSLYLPYNWDDLEDGTMQMKKAKNNKFFTDIELHLKKYGMLQLRLGLFENNQLNINITTKSEELKALIQGSLTGLKKNLIDAGIQPMSIRFLEENKPLDDAYSSSDNLDIGFEVKV